MTILVMQETSDQNGFGAAVVVVDMLTGEGAVCGNNDLSNAESSFGGVESTMIVAHGIVNVQMLGPQRKERQKL